MAIIASYSLPFLCTEHFYLWNKQLFIFRVVFAVRMFHANRISAFSRNSNQSKVKLFRGFTLSVQYRTSHSFCHWNLFVAAIAYLSCNKSFRRRLNAIFFSVICCFFYVWLHSAAGCTALFHCKKQCAP